MIDLKYAWTFGEATQLNLLELLEDFKRGKVGRNHLSPALFSALKNFAETKDVTVIGEDGSDSIDALAELINNKSFFAEIMATEEDSSKRLSMIKTYATILELFNTKLDRTSKEKLKELDERIKVWDKVLSLVRSEIAPKLNEADRERLYKVFEEGLGQ